ncbi:hypothetical protein [Nocardia sp. NBC_00511]|uniref:hypothetical protein n=1 Tax=Nocardia sp. NBC_00511 TaxID=2903591 RepID=UPI0030E36837
MSQQYPDPRLRGRPELAMLLADLLRRAHRGWRARRTRPDLRPGDVHETEL